MLRLGGALTVSGYSQGGVYCPPYATMCAVEAAAAASASRLGSSSAVTFRSITPGAAGTGGGTAARIYGMGFSGGGKTMTQCALPRVLLTF